MDRRLIEVAAGLIFREGRLLVTQRPAGSHLAGYWEFPGGKREVGETWEDCLRRELMEEVGIEVAVERDLWEVTHVYPERTVFLRFFVGHWISGEPRTLGCQQLAWIRAEELDRYNFPPADLQILSRVKLIPEFHSKSL
jgi:8-oxo-dGTP diphosphatase